MTATSKFLKVLVPIAIVGTLLAGCSGGGEADPTASATTAGPPSEPTGTLRINWGSAPSTWAPGARIEPGYFYVPYESIVLLGDDNEILPNLATEWVEEPMALTLTLRDDVTFHDGTPFNAEAVKANLEYVRDNPGAYSGPLQAVASVDIVDEFTAKVNFKYPSPTFLTMLTRNNVMVASPTAIAAGTVVDEPVGTGPWKYDAENSIAGTKYAFTLNEDYWGTPVHFENVELYAIADDTSAVAALLGDELDVTDVELDQMTRIESVANIDSYDYAAVRNNVVYFDRAPGGAFGEVDVRKALCTSLDTDGYAQYAADTLATPDQHFVEGELGYNADIKGFPFDLKAAQKTLGGATAEGTMPAAPFLKGQLEFFADNMNQLDGVNITVQDLAVPDFQSTWNTGKYGLGIGQNAEITPYDWYQSWFAASARQNPSGYESPELKAAADAAKAAGTTDEADALWQEVMKIIIDDEALACGFVIGGQTIGWNTDTVAGVQEAPNQPFMVNLIDYRSIYPVTAG